MRNFPRCRGPQDGSAFGMTAAESDLPSARLLGCTGGARWSGRSAHASHFPKKRLPLKRAAERLATPRRGSQRSCGTCPAVPEKCGAASGGGVRSSAFTRRGPPEGGLRARFAGEAKQIPDRKSVLPPPHRQQHLIHLLAQRLRVGIRKRRVERGHGVGIVR